LGKIEVKKTLIFLVEIGHLVRIVWLDGKRGMNGKVVFPEVEEVPNQCGRKN